MVDRRAVAGVQMQRVGGRPVYLMPNTSGINAHSRLADLVHHLGTAAQLADYPPVLEQHVEAVERTNFGKELRSNGGPL